MSSQWIVSAAHCFAYGDDPNQYSIVAGDFDKLFYCFIHVYKMTEILRAL